MPTNVDFSNICRHFIFILKNLFAAALSLCVFFSSVNFSLPGQALYGNGFENK